MGLSSFFVAVASVSLGVQLVAGSAATHRREEESPTVDLGYAVHQATLNEGDFYSFNNIRYAEAPVGDLRFKKPILPKTTDRTINNGSVTNVCPQGYPSWALESQAAALNLTVELIQDLLMLDPAMNEDCLFLDIHVPTNVFEEGQARADDGPSCGEKKKGAPVMVWIYGGGYTTGSKSEENYDPAGLIKISQESGSEPIIYVAMNYRLGLFGWLDGGSDADILPNAGLHDQRLALRWIKKNIRRFGGDPHRITVFGESAGGGSIMHHVTAYGGHGKKGKAGFEKAIIQSPGWSNTLDSEGAWERTLAAATEIAGTEITDADGLRQLTSRQLMDVNQAVVFDSAYGDFSFGPTVDGYYVPDLPSVLLLEGKFDHSVQIMVGHNTNESASFVPPTDSAEQTEINLQAVAVDVSDETLDFILTELYPPVYDGSQNYTSEFARATLIASEMSFTCNTRYLGTAFRETYNYRFQVPPGLHAQDVPYTFFTGTDEEVEDGVIAEVAEAMQKYFVEFSRDGTPHVEGLPTWPKYQSGNGDSILTFGTDGVGFAADDVANERCQYWQTGDYLD